MRETEAAAVQPLDETALAALMSRVEEHTAAAEKQWSEGTSKDAGQRRARTKSGAAARRRAAGREQGSTEGEEVLLAPKIILSSCLHQLLPAGLL